MESVLKDNETCVNSIKVSIIYIYMYKKYTFHTLILLLSLFIYYRTMKQTLPPTPLVWKLCTTSPSRGRC